MIASCMSAAAASLYGRRAAPPTPRIGYGSARGGRLAAHQRLRARRRLALRVVLGDAVPRLPRAALVAQIAVAEADLEERVGHLRGCRREVEHLLEFRHGLPVVALHVVRL